MKATKTEIIIFKYNFDVLEKIDRLPTLKKAPDFIENQSAILISLNNLNLECRFILDIKTSIILTIKFN